MFPASLYFPLVDSHEDHFEDFLQYNTMKSVGGRRSISESESALWRGGAISPHSDEHTHPSRMIPDQRAPEYYNPHSSIRSIRSLLESQRRQRKDEEEHKYGPPHLHARQEEERGKMFTSTRGGHNREVGWETFPATIARGAVLTDDEDEFKIIKMRFMARGVGVGP